MLYNDISVILLDTLLPLCKSLVSTVIFQVLSVPVFEPIFCIYDQQGQPEQRHPDGPEMALKASLVRSGVLSPVTTSPAHRKPIGQGGGWLRENTLACSCPGFSRRISRPTRKHGGRALQNVYKVTGEIDEIKSDYCRIDSLLVYLSSDDLATLNKGDTLVFLGQISSTEDETRPEGLGTVTITHILFSNAILLETTPQQAGDSKE